ncbi:MAG: potassium transporter TrkG [Haloarculaceae archaeon]
MSTATVVRGRADRFSSDLRTILRDVGSLLVMQSALIGGSVAVSLAFREWYPAAAFAGSAALTGAVGLSARRAFADAPDPKMKHGMIIAALGWLATAAFGSLPFLLTAYLTPPAVAATYVPPDAAWDAATVAGRTSRSSLVYFRDPLHAFFESMSGWTGSGLTMAVHEPSLPRALQWWRSLIQWVGGVGVIVLTVSILARPGSGSYALYRSEARERRIHPSIVSTVRTVWKLVVGYTLLSAAALFVALSTTEYASRLPLWEVGWQALNHAMTGLATGGFSVTDESIATYGSPLVETVLLPTMTLGAIAFPVHYAVVGERDYRELLGDLQTRWLFVLLGAGVVALSAQNAWSLGSAPGAFSRAGVLPAGAPVDLRVADAVRDSTFQWVSALTCTGFQSAPIGRWAEGSKVLLSGAMVVGGAAGSTVGGIKVIRAYTVARGIGWQFGRVFLPANAVVTARIDGRSLTREAMEREFNEATVVSLLWLLLLAASSVLLVDLVGPSFSYADALFEVASAQGNVGLSTGITGPSMPAAAEAMFVVNMWVGRLEIIPVLVFARSLLYGLEPR